MALDFAGDGGFLYQLSSTLLFWEDETNSCRAVGMLRSDSDTSFRGSLSLLWPFFKSLCLGQFVETLSCAVTGRPVMAETGMSVFEHSLAFAEAEAVLSNHLGLNIFGFPKSTGFKHIKDTPELSATKFWLSRNGLFDKLNTTPEVLLMAFISCLNSLSSHTLAVFNLQSKYRLLNTGLWGLCFMSSFVWGFFSFKPTIGADGILLRFPTVCVVGFIPHLLVLIAILSCIGMYLLAISLAVFSPPVGSTPPKSWMERVAVAHENMQANIHLSTIRINTHEDFYNALLKIGFTTLTVASEAIYLNEGKRIGVHRWTWLEDERLLEFRDSTKPAGDYLDHGDSAITTNGAQPTDENSTNTTRGRHGGYARERTSKSLRNLPESRALAGADGVGTLQRTGRFMGAWGLNTGTFWLMTGWLRQIVLRALHQSGVIKIVPSWNGLLAPHLRSARKTSKSNIGRPREPSLGGDKSLDFWILSDDGNLSSPKDDNFDVAIEMRKRLRMSSDTWGAREEKRLDETLYDWWVHGGRWGDHDDSGSFVDLAQAADDLTSEVSTSENWSEDEDWESEDGRTTPTQQDPNPFLDSRENSPFPDHTLDPSHLARLLNPQEAEERQEALMLAQHLTSDRVITRSQYRHMEGSDRSQLLTSNRFSRPAGFRPSRPNGRLTPQEEAEILEHMIISNRSRKAGTWNMSSDVSSTWKEGGEGLGSGGPQCVVCQSAPRTILAWPCRCLSVCEECRVQLAMNNYGSCVCCRQEVTSFSRLYVP